MAIYRTPINKSRKKVVSGNTIYHVKFGDDENYYFGSIAAIYDTFTPERLGGLFFYAHLKQVYCSCNANAYIFNANALQVFCIALQVEKTPKNKQ